MNNIEQKISSWLSDYLTDNNLDSFVIGISGGIDSAVTSTLCAMTGYKTYVVVIPIHQKEDETDRGLEHCEWLKKKYPNVEDIKIDLTSTFDHFKSVFPSNFKNQLTLANSRARIRMSSLYFIAGNSNGIVVGTGNKVEDFGVGFYTKYGDGGVDISPIADCTKSQIWEMGKNLGVLKEIVEAQPTDGLWDDGRTDVNQLGMSYQELEEAMKDSSNKNHKKYLEIRKRNLHKMNPVPVCKMKDD